jgi:hypothetical protein
MNTVTLQEAKEAKQALVAAISTALSVFTDKTGLRVEAVNVSCTFPDIGYLAYGKVMEQDLAYNTLTKETIRPSIPYDVDVTIPM